MKRSVVSAAGAGCISGEDEDDEVMLKYEKRIKENRRRVRMPELATIFVRQGVL